MGESEGKDVRLKLVPLPIGKPNPALPPQEQKEEMSKVQQSGLWEEMFINTGRRDVESQSAEEQDAYADSGVPLTIHDPRKSQQSDDTVLAVVVDASNHAEGKTATFQDPSRKAEINSRWLFVKHVQYAVENPAFACVCGDLHLAKAEPTQWGGCLQQPDDQGSADIYRTTDCSLTTRQLVCLSMMPLNTREAENLPPPPIANRLRLELSFLGPNERNDDGRECPQGRKFGAMRDFAIRTPDAVRAADDSQLGFVLEQLNKARTGVVCSEGFKVNKGSLKAESDLMKAACDLKPEVLDRLVGCLVDEQDTSSTEPGAAAFVQVQALGGGDCPAFSLKNMPPEAGLHPQLSRDVVRGWVALPQERFAHEAQKLLEGLQPERALPLCSALWEGGHLENPDTSGSILELCARAAVDLEIAGRGTPVENTVMAKFLADARTLSKIGPSVSR